MSDRILLPPLTREASSPGGRFHLTIQAVDGWKSPRARAELREDEGASAKLLWSLHLPHEQGPRRALISDQGEVILVDEWINVASRRALTLIGTNGKVRASYSAEEIFAVLAVPLREVTAHAKLGIWLAAEPVFSRDGRAVLFQGGGRHLALRLDDGKLSLAD